MKEFLRKLKSFSGFVGSVSVLVPGVSFFLKYTPPLFDGIWILVSSLSAAFLWFGYKSTTARTRNSNSRKYIIAGFVLAVVYLILLDQTSIIVRSDDNSIRYQIGWNMSNWSLTPDAKFKIEHKICLSTKTKEELFYCYGVNRINTFLIWEEWTIYIFGILNILVFTLSCLLWSFGWGKIIKTG